MGLDLIHFTPVHKSDNTNLLDFFSINDVRIAPEYFAINEKYIVDVDNNENGVERGIHFDSKGYQRKGMKSTFYTDFKNDTLYFDLEHVKKAYGYLVADHIRTLPELQSNFKQNFLDNFIETESIFFVSW